MSHDSPSDPLQFVRNMWNNMGFSLPGMVTPTLDIDELDKRIKDMKAVEGWLKMNLNMLQMTIQGLEVQRSTLSALKSVGEASAYRRESGDANAGANPFENNPFSAATLWPWMQAMGGMAGHAAAEPDPEPEAAPAPEAKAATGASDSAMKSANAFSDAAAAATNAAMWPWQLMADQAAEAQKAPAKKAAPKKPAATRAKTAAAAPAKRAPAAAAGKPATTRTKKTP